MLFQVAFAITWCPTIVKQSEDAVNLVPYLNATFNQNAQAIDMNLSVPYISDSSKYTYMLDFGDKTFKFSNFENRSQLSDTLTKLTQVPTAEYACQNKLASSFVGGNNWKVVVNNCNYITFTTQVQLDSTAFHRVQEAGNVKAYTAELRLFRVTPGSASRTRSGETLSEEYLFEIRVDQRIQTGYDSKDLNKIHYFVPNVNVQDEPSVFQSKMDGNTLKTYLSIDRLQIMKATSSKQENVSYDTLDRAASCSAEGQERVLNTTLRSLGDNTRTIEIIYSNLDCVKNTTSSQDILNVYITETVTVTVGQAGNYALVSIKPVNETIHKLTAPQGAQSVSAVHCDGNKLSGGVFNRSQCKNIELNYSINGTPHVYKAQIGELAGNVPALYTYDPYETLHNMSWNDGTLCNYTQENAFITSKDTFCQANPVICEQVDAPNLPEEEETPVTPPSQGNGTNSSTNSTGNSTNTTTPPTNSTGNSTTNSTGNSTNNSTGNTTGPSTNTTGNNTNQTTPEPEECVGDDCAADGIGRGKMAIVGAAAAAAAAIGILI